MLKFHLLYLKQNGRRIKTGFSIIEMMLVISVLAMLAAAAFASLNENRSREVLDGAQASIVNALELAQNRAATGVGIEKHGVKITTNSFTICGDTEASFENPTQLNNITTNQSDLFISFNRISAKPNLSTDIIITHAISGLQKTITITPEGKIVAQ